MLTAVILLRSWFLILAPGLLLCHDQSGPISWKQCLKHKPEWYASPDAVRIANQVLLYQRVSGGWPKNIDMAAPLSETERAELAKQQADPKATIDNGATYTQMAYLGRVFNATKQVRFQDAFVKALDYLLKAQYDNGGWPQFYPNPTGYQTHITFNDDAMIGVLNLLRQIAQKQPLYAFVDETRLKRCERAIAKGIDCILKCQVVVGGRRTVWCAQHDEKTLQPAPARSYEKVSLSGAESVGIVRFLMAIDKPSPQVVDAIKSSVAWFEKVKLIAIRVVERPIADAPNGFDKVVEADPEAPPIWARFYEIGTNRPIFCGRDGVIKYSLEEIDQERRTGYAWYGDRPARLLSRDYPQWQKKVGIRK